jgi:hypothetical protein
VINEPFACQQRFLMPVKLEFSGTKTAKKEMVFDKTRLKLLECLKKTL